MHIWFLEKFKIHILHGALQMLHSTRWINAVALKSLWKRWIEVDVDEKDNRRRGKGTEGVVL